MTDPAVDDVTALRQDIEQHREELAASVDALATKLDVKAQLRTKTHELTAELRPYALPVGGALAVVLLLVTVVKRRRS